MEALKRGLGLTKRRSEPEADEPLPPLPREPTVPHHWLSIVVVRPGPLAPLPAPGARIVVRPYPRGAAKPEEPVARGVAGADGSFQLLLPEGRYAVAAQHEGEARAVTITLEHAGRATLSLESLGRRVTLTVEVSGEDGLPRADAMVSVRSVAAGTEAARGVTDADGVAQIHLPPGAYQVQVGRSVARTYVETDTLLRLTAEPGAMEPAANAPVSRYAQKARAATSAVAPIDLSAVRDETWN